MTKANGWWIGLSCSLFAGAAFGAQFPVAGHVLKQVTPLYFVGIRYVIAAAVFAGLLALKEGRRAFRLEGRTVWIWLLGTFAFTGYNGLVFIGQRLAGPPGPILSSVMMGFMPLVTALILWIWKRKRLSPITSVCIIIGLAGVFLVATKGQIGVLAAGTGTGGGLLLMLAAVVCWCVYTVGGSGFPNWSPLRYTTLTCIGGTFSNAIVIGAGTAFGALHAPTAQQVLLNVWPFLYMSLIAGVAAVLAWNTASKQISPVDAALFTNNVIPIMSVGITVLSGYSISAIELAGIGLTLVALIANNLGGRRQVIKSRKTEPDTASGTTANPA